MKYILAALLCFIVASVHANPPPKKHVPGAKSTPTTPAGARSVSEAKAIGSGTGIGVGTGGNSTATGGAGGSGSGSASAAIGPVDITVQGAAAAPDSVTIKNVPDVTVMIASPTSSCRNTYGVGIGLAGFGGSLASSELDVGCDTREDARLLFNMGLQTESVARLCAKPEMATALGAKCPPKKPE